MADNKNYYYLRLKENFFEDDAIQILESMQDGYLYSNILLKLYAKSLKMNGKLMFNERIPYNPTVLGTITRHSVGTVEKALEVFEQLGLIEVLDNGAIYMLDIQNFIGKTSTEADRKRAYRDQIEQEKKKLSGQMSGQISDKSIPEIDIELEKEIDTEIKKETKTKKKRESINYQQIADMYNNTCVSLPKVKTLSNTRKRMIKARLKSNDINDFEKLFKKAEESDFLTGRNKPKQAWHADFNWLMNESNMEKTLEGNYDNKGAGNNDQHGTIGNATAIEKQQQYRNMLYEWATEGEEE